MLTVSQFRVKNMRIGPVINDFLLLAAIFSISAAVQAEMYKWVDADGNTHYTQSPPPPGIEGKTLKSPSKVNKDLADKQAESRQKYVDDARKKRNEVADKQKKETETAAAKKAKCDQAKSRLATYERPRVNLVDEDGKRTRATEERRQAELAKSRKLVAELCK